MHMSPHTWAHTHVHTYTSKQPHHQHPLQCFTCRSRSCSFCHFSCLRRSSSRSQDQWLEGAMEGTGIWRKRDIAFIGQTYPAITLITTFFPPIWCLNTSHSINKTIWVSPTIIHIFIHFTCFLFHCFIVYVLTCYPCTVFQFLWLRWEVQTCTWTVPQ